MSPVMVVTPCDGRGVSDDDFIGARGRGRPESGYDEQDGSEGGAEGREGRSGDGTGDR